MGNEQKIRKPGRKDRGPLVYEGSVLRAPDLTSSQRDFIKSFGIELPYRVRLVRRTTRSEIEAWSWTKAKGQEQLTVDIETLKKAIEAWRVQQELETKQS